MFITCVLVLSSIVTMLLLGRTVWALHRFAYRPVELKTDELPSVSVCIAARNETHALAQCLERVLKSDYEKLEILVLDDSSNDDTSLIIKSFAGAGVRFIAGKPLPHGWLGKNHAHQTLIDEASGDIVLFLDVDTTIKSTSVTQLVSQLVANDKVMVSVLPRREDSYRVSALFGTVRYYWELLLTTSANPPTASALWMAWRTKLQEAGLGLADYGLSVRPERHLARRLQKAKDYYYLIGTGKLGVGYEKRLHSQYETATRLYYPMLGKNFIAFLVGVVAVLLLVAPTILLISGSSNIVFDVWSLVLIVLSYVAFGMFVNRTHSGINRQLRLFLWPILLVREVILLAASFLAYSFGKVTWKDRPVTSQPSRSEALNINE